jgi:cobalt/nickel transport system permease protein
MHLEEFAEGDSFFHRLDPRVKFMTLFPYIVVVALMQGINGPLLALFFSILMVVFAKLDFRKLIERLIGFNIFILLLWLILPFNYPGKIIFNIGNLSISYEGILYTGSITFKANAIILATIAMLGTSDVFSLTHALYHLKFPSKLINLFFFFYRYLTVLHSEFLRLRNAMIIRGFRPMTNIHTYKTYAYLIGMLIVRSYERAESVYKAMLCRGFRGKFRIISHFKIRGIDIIFGTIMSLITICMGIIFIWGKI